MCPAAISCKSAGRCSSERRAQQSPWAHEPKQGEHQLCPQCWSAGVAQVWGGRSATGTHAGVTSAVGTAAPAGAAREVGGEKT